MEFTINPPSVNAAREITRICKALQIESEYQYNRGDQTCHMEVDCPDGFEESMWAIVNRVVDLSRE